MKQIKIIILLGLVLVTGIVSAQSSRKFVRRGNDFYKKNKFTDAEVEYRKALDKQPDYFKGKFNLGDAFYKQNNWKNADSLFTELAASAKTPDAKAKAWYNKGNTLLNQKKYQKSIDAYRNALLLNPKNDSAKYNLEYARKKLKKHQQQKKQNKKNQKKNQKKNKQQNKNQKKKNEKKNNKKNQNKQKQKQQQKQKQKQQEQNKNKQGGKKKQQPRSQQISKQEAKRMLDALKNGEKKTLHKLELQKAKAERHKTYIIDW